MVVHIFNFIELEVRTPIWFLMSIRIISKIICIKNITKIINIIFKVIEYILQKTINRTPKLKLLKRRRLHACFRMLKYKLSLAIRVFVIVFYILFKWFIKHWVIKIQIHRTQHSHSFFVWIIELIMIPVSKVFNFILNNQCKIIKLEHRFIVI